MLRTYVKCARAWVRFRGYQPQKVTWKSLMNWLRPYNAQDQHHLLELLDSVNYLTEEETRRILVNQNRSLLNYLSLCKIPPEKIIYVQLHDAGSSSPVMLNMLRDAANLERRGCKFVDSNNVRRLNELTGELEEGAIIYVDDFVGTGDQFEGVRQFIGEYILGSFSEFLLVPAICEEGVLKLGKLGVQPRAQYIHSIAERPLQETCTIFTKGIRERLCNLSFEVRSPDPYGLGYKNLASMIVLYRNAPDTVPYILRGSKDQNPRQGIFPRSSDLPIVN
jgi:hypothetical protein